MSNKFHPLKRFIDATQYVHMSLNISQNTHNIVYNSWMMHRRVKGNDDTCWFNP